MKKIIFAVLTAAFMVSFSPMCVYADEWVQNDNGYVYQYDDGTTAPKGWLKLGDKTYYIQKDGTRKTGWLKMTSGKKYYFKKDGTMVTGLLKLSSGKYYFDKNGVMQTGYKKIGKKIYNFGSNGVLKEQVKNSVVEIDGKYYYCLEDGSLAKGMVDIPFSDGTYLTAYFGDAGYSISCEKEIDGVTYVFDEIKGLTDAYIDIKTVTNCYVEYKNASKVRGSFHTNFSAECRVKSKYSSYYNVDIISEYTSAFNTDAKIVAYANIYDEDGYKVDTCKISEIDVWANNKKKTKKTLSLKYIPSKIEITEIKVTFY